MKRLPRTHDHTDDVILAGLGRPNSVLMKWMELMPEPLLPCLAFQQFGRGRSRGAFPA
jgi:hypothetical protein